MDSAERIAATKVALWINRPEPLETIDMGSPSYFDPWEMLGSQVYGSYESAFDQMAIQLLEDLRDQRWSRTDLASRMFREMLCLADLCDYGSSPSVCFPTTHFAEILPPLIEKWKRYYAAQWGEVYEPDADDI